MQRTNWKTLWLCFLFATLFFLGTAPPASADIIGPVFDTYAPANGTKLPGGWVTVEVRVLDADGIQYGSQQLLINGQAVPAVLNYDVKSIDPVTETVIYDLTHAVITYRKLYSDSMNNVQLTVKDQAGNTSVLNWTFEIVTAPTVTNLTPAHDTATTNTTPAISATVTHPAGGTIDPASVIMTLDGVQVLAAYDPAAGLVSYTPAAPLTVGQTYIVSVTAADTNSHVTNKQWNFNVVYPDMPVPNTKADCLRCHTSQPQSHRMDNCAACHDVALRKIYANQSPPPHFVAYSCSACHITKSHEQGAIAGQTAWWPIDTKYSCEQCHTHNIDTIAPRHQSTTTGDCSQCHSMILEREHYRAGRTDKLGNPIDCFTCHTSARPEVQQAIATRNTACEACHTAGHAASHTNPTYTTLTKDPDMDCALCHNNDIATEHTTGTDAAGVTMTCDTCHKSTRPEVTGAITNKNKNCEACHIDPLTNQPRVHTASGSPLHDTTYMLNPEVNCQQCHANSVKTVHVGQINTATNTAMDCATCHNSANPAVQAAITVKDTKCDACHAYPPARYQPVHTTNVFTVDNTRPDAGTCVTCHNTTNLTTLHVGKVNSVTNQAMNCDTCHASADPKVVNAIANKSANSCEACHTVHAPKDATAIHDSTDVFAAQTETDCASCHSRNVKVEHIDKGRIVGGTAMTCDSCHGSSARQQVKDAIAANNTRCDACHTMPPTMHNPTHNAVVFTSDTTRTDQTTCSMCHVKVLSDQHANKVTAAGVTMNCNTCHSSAASATVKAAIMGKNGNCEACHTMHPVKSAVTQHDSTDVFATNADVNCTGCHQRNIRTEHLDNPARTTTTGQPITCDACHGSSNTFVQTAITAKDNKCTACHAYPPAKHQPVHTTNIYTTDTTRTDDCSLCHAKAIKDEHVGRVNSVTGQAMTCDTCHASTDLKVVNAVANKSTNSCEACHTLHPVKDVSQLHDSINFTNNTYTDTNMNCANCHNKIVSAEHVNKTTEAGVTMTCDTCHKSTRPDVQNAIATNNLKCEACHTKVHTSPDAYHATTFVTNKTMACEKCHDANSIANDHTKYKTSTGSAITCDTCHKSTDTKVINAIRTSNTGCDTCHTTRHTDVQIPHKTTYIPDTAYNCSSCHAAANIAYNMTASYHKITGVTPTINLLHGGTFVSPWTATSTLTCRDCHNKNNSTNTYYDKLLKGAYTATTGKQGYSTANQLCFFCHSTSAYGPGSSRSANSGFKGDGSTNWHAIGNHTEKGGCMACHTGKPHSGSKQGFIAIKGATEPNSLITAYSHTASYSKSNCTTSCH